MALKLLKRIGRKVKNILFPVNESNAESLNGNNISKSAIMFAGVTVENTTIGDYSYVSNNCVLYSCSIGKFSSIGPGTIIGAGEHPTNFVSTSPICYQSTTSFDIHPQTDKFYGLSTVEIGNDVWIGAQCYVKNGVKIGHGAIVGVGSIVLADVEPYTIMIGTPAKKLRYRFEAPEIERLLNIKWWDWTPEVIRERLDDIGSDNIANFTDKYK